MIVYSQENLHKCWAEVEDMLYGEQAEEISASENKAHGMVLNLDMDLHKQLEEANKLLIICARDFDTYQLYGYLMAFIISHPSYKHLLAVNIVRRFVTRSMRSKGIGTGLLQFTEIKAKEYGCNYILLGEKSHLDYKTPTGYNLIERTYIKWLL